MSRLGIDVSDNQGYINWDKVKAAGVEFAILRSVRRSGNVDKQLASNIAGCLKNGIPFDFYKFSYALSEKAAIQEAKEVIAALAKLGVKPSSDTVIWMDVEWDNQIALSKSVLTNIVKAFEKEVVAAGFSFGIYMGKYDYNKDELNVNEVGGHTWLARYYNGYNVMQFGTKPNEQYKPTAKDGELWGWQFTSSGRVSGINGNVDMDIAYYDIKPTVVEPKYYETPEFTLIDSLNKIGVDSSYKNRKGIAAKNGIEDYSGTAEQNIQMLSLLNEGKLIQI